MRRDVFGPLQIKNKGRDINYVLIICSAYFGYLIFGSVPSIVNTLYIQIVASVDFNCFRKISAQRYSGPWNQIRPLKKLATTNVKLSLTNAVVVTLECSSKCKVRIQFAKSARNIRPFFLFCQPDPPLLQSKERSYSTE